MIVGLFIAFGVAAWVFSDARSLAERGTPVGTTTPGAWAAGVFLFLIVFLPIYLVKRSAAVRPTVPPMPPMYGSAGFCTSCGQPLPAGGAFCPGCGVPAGRAG